MPDEFHYKVSFAGKNYNAPKHPRCSKKLKETQKKLCQFVEEGENHKTSPY